MLATGAFAWRKLSGDSTQVKLTKYAAKHSSFIERFFLRGNSALFTIQTATNKKIISSFSFGKTNHGYNAIPTRNKFARTTRTQRGKTYVRTTRALKSRLVLPRWSYFMARNMSTNHKTQQSKLKAANKTDSDCLSHHSSQSSIDCKQQTPVLFCISQTLDNHGSDGTSGS